MKAKDISGQAPGGKRTRLADAVPLDTPFVFQVFPIYACNFKCGYCIFSIDKSKRGFISDRPAMDLALYRKCVDDMAGFPKRIKVLRFVGIGEPLLHKDIVEMVALTVSKGVAGTVEILSNASLLKPSLSDALLDAGLNRLVVSVQGTSKEKYRAVSGVDIDFDGLISNLRHFYERSRGRAQIYVKVVDSALDGKDDERRFYELFGDVCDTIGIEHTVPIHAGIDFGKLLKGKESSVTQFGLPLEEVKICPQPFFTMQLNPDGKVVPCYSFEYPRIVGDCNFQSVVDIWNGKEFQRLRRAMLDGAKLVSETCANCNIVKYRLFPEDDLRDAAERLKKHCEV